MLGFNLTEGLANTRLELLIKESADAQTFSFTVDGDVSIPRHNGKLSLTNLQAPCTKIAPTVTQPIAPSPTIDPNACTATPTAPGDLKCTTSHMAPRSDCGSALLAKLPFGNNGGIDQSSCLPGSAGTNAAGENFCSLAVNGQCSLVAAYGQGSLEPQSRDDVAAVINDSTFFCFQVCGSGVLEGSTIQGQDGKTRLSVIETGSEASS